MSENNFWEKADHIHVYTRQQALEDGLLFDVSEIAREAGHPYPTAITLALHTRLTPNDFEKAMGQDYEGRLWDVLWLAYLTCLREAKKPANEQRNPLFFKVIIQEQGSARDRLVKHMITIKLSIALDENGDLCITMDLAT